MKSRTTQIIKGSAKQIIKFISNYAIQLIEFIINNIIELIKFFMKAGIGTPHNLMEIIMFIYNNVIKIIKFIYYQFIHFLSRLFLNTPHEVIKQQFYGILALLLALIIHVLLQITSGVDFIAQIEYFYLSLLPLKLALPMGYDKEYENQTLG